MAQTGEKGSGSTGTNNNQLGKRNRRVQRWSRHEGVDNTMGPQDGQRPINEILLPPWENDSTGCKQKGDKRRSKKNARQGTPFSSEKWGHKTIQISKSPGQKGGKNTSAPGRLRKLDFRRETRGIVNRKNLGDWEETVVREPVETSLREKRQRTSGKNQDAE